MNKHDRAVWDRTHIQCVIYSGKTTILFYYDGRQISYFDRPKMRKRFEWWLIVDPYDTYQCKLLSGRYRGEIPERVLRIANDLYYR